MNASIPPAKASVKELNECLNKVTVEIEKINKELDKLGKQAQQINDRQSALNERFQNIRHRALVLYECLFTRKRLPKTLIGLRAAYISAINLAAVEDSIRKRGALEADEKKLLEQLREACHHPFVFSYDGHEGSYSDDYEDQYPGRRLCLMCGLTEVSKSTKGDEYEVLSVVDETDERLVKRDIRRREKQRPLFMEKSALLSLPYIREIFLNSAGNRNVVWPHGDEFTEYKETEKKCA